MQKRHRHTLNYFWKLKTGGEIDLIEDENAYLYPVEFKWNKDKPVTKAHVFTKQYQNSAPITVINRDNFLEFIK
jgi:predicted AAA+ superfamily ATPase